MATHLNYLKTAAIISLAVTICSAALAQTNKIDNVAEDIKKLEHARFEAYLHLDAKALERMMADDYMSIYANGEIVTKGREIEGIKGASPNTLSGITAGLDQLSVRSYGHVAILRGILKVKGKIAWSERDIDLDASFRYTAVYVKDQDSWRITFSQFTAIEPESDK